VEEKKLEEKFGYNTVKIIPLLLHNVKKILLFIVLSKRRPLHEMKPLFIRVLDKIAVILRVCAHLDK